MQRRVKNQCLAAVGYIWAFAALTASSQARAHYDRRRAIGDGHGAALQNLYNRFLSQLHHCLATRETYRAEHAFPVSLTSAAALTRPPPTTEAPCNVTAIGCLTPGGGWVRRLVATLLLFHGVWR